MKKTSHSAFNKAQLITAGKKRYVHYFEFAKKDAIIKYIEITGTIAIAVIVVAGLYGFFN
ncbi:hypothetical protein [Flavobacterium sp. NRK1]|jgi:hypothetical protein|uniref:hypothetical protein n=1 Tax=Flavobacterium sp. NRK1 TaxID=2954929 RepID=UPI002092B92B|nr:hypothetical protein [Flavobacterium sp. NRK1]MCO6148445.1 hypothetical protein [Flavobacterium sp. NRK1]